MGRNGYSRRDFLRIGGALAAAAGLPAEYVAVFAQGMRRLSQGLPRVLWMQGQACAGCSVSLLNAEDPTILYAVTEHLSLVFHPTLSAAQGRLAMQVIEQVQRGEEPFILVVEGAIPVGMPEACRIGGRTFADVLAPLLRRARFVLAAGTCASFGGIPSADGNPTGAGSVRAFMEKSAVAVEDRLVCCPGCPAHPDEMLGTLAHLAAEGYPQVRASSLVPVMYSEACLHDTCPRFSQYAARVFALHLGDAEGCLYSLGCQGLDVYADCQRRQSNGKVNWCIQAAAPCIGCRLPLFGKSRSLPFYRIG
jgi:hydrogenase small subunit